MLQCTKSCDGGIQFRSVRCVGGEACRVSLQPQAEQDCNTQPCPSTTTTTPITMTTTPDTTTVTIATTNTTTSITTNFTDASSSLSSSTTTVLPSPGIEKEETKSRKLRKKLQDTTYRHHNTVLEESNSEDFTDDSSGYEVPVAAVGSDIGQKTLSSQVGESVWKSRDDEYSGVNASKTDHDASVVNISDEDTKRDHRLSEPQLNEQHFEESTNATVFATNRPSIAISSTSAPAPVTSTQEPTTSTHVPTKCTHRPSSSTPIPFKSTSSQPKVVAYRWTPLFWGKVSIYMTV